MDDMKQKLNELTRKSLTVEFGDITLVDDGYRVTARITKQGSQNVAVLTVSVPRSGKRAGSRKWDKRPDQIREEARRAMASFSEAISKL